MKVYRLDNNNVSCINGGFPVGGYIRCEGWQNLDTGCMGILCIILATLCVSLTLFQNKVKKRRMNFQKEKNQLEEILPG